MYRMRCIRAILLFAMSVVGVLSARGSVEVVLSLKDVEFRSDAKTGKRTALVTQGESFEATVLVRGSTVQPNNVYIEGSDQFQLSGPSVMQSMRSVNGVTSFETRYTFEVVGVQQGLFTFGPAHVVFGRDDLTSDAYAIRVEDVLVSSERTERREARQARRAPERQAYLRLESSQEQAFVGQPILLTVSFYHGDSIPTQSFQLTPVHTPGFVTREIEGLTAGRELFKGVEFNVIRKKIALIPVSTGEHTIPAVRALYNVPPPGRDRFNDPFLSMFAGHRLEQKQALSNVLPINIKELPASAQHVDGIGTFRDFSVQVDRSEVVQNEPVKLTVTVAGNGNVENLDRVSLNMPRDIKLYDPKVTFKRDSSLGMFGGVKTFEYVMQVRMPGLVTIPAQRFSYFNPHNGEVSSLTSTPIEMSVASSSDHGTSSEHPPSQVTNDSSHQTRDSGIEPNVARHSDIRFIDEDGVVFYRPGVLESISVPLFLVLVCLPFLLMLGMVHRMIRNLFNARRSARGGKALVAALRKDMLRAIDDGALDRVRELCIEFFACVSGGHRAHITEDWIKQYLQHRGVAPSESDQFITFLTECAAFSFAQSGSLNRITKNDMKRSVKQWTQMLHEIVG